MSDGEKARQLARFVHATIVEVQLAHRADLKEVWTRDISQGGLFVETDRPPPLDAVLRVVLRVENGGKLVLDARVVHVLKPEQAEQIGAAPGVGLQLMPMSAEQRRMLDAYIDGIAERLAAETADLGTPAMTIAPEEVAAGVADARRLLETISREDLYRTLGISPRANPAEIKSCFDELLSRFERIAPAASPPQRARLDTLRTQLDKVRRLLGDQERRLEYDLRHGHLFIEERIASSEHDGLAMARMRDVWCRVFPQKLHEAALHASAAERFERLRDFAQASRAGRAALELDPFNEVLRKAIADWESRLSSKKNS